METSFREFWFHNSKTIYAIIPILFEEDAQIRYELPYIKKTSDGRSFQ